MELSKMPMEELLQFEKAAKIVCSNYEEYTIFPQKIENEEFIKAKTIYNKIYVEIEKRIWELY